MLLAPLGSMVRADKHSVGAVDVAVTSFNVLNDEVEQGLYVYFVFLSTVLNGSGLSYSVLLGLVHDVAFLPQVLTSLVLVSACC